MRHPLRRTATATIVIGVLLMTGCLAAPRPDTGRTDDPGEPTVLPRSEVREYEGQDLSSIDDFRENSIAGPQVVERESYRLKVEGLVGQPLALAYDDVLEFSTYRKVVTLDCVEGWSVDILWEGVLVRDIIERAGPSLEADTVVFRAVDGYSTSLPLAYLMDDPILLAYSMNGYELVPERGFPFQLVAEDKWGYKWIKWIDEIELTDDPSFRGYWESRGYSNSGDLDSGFYE